MSDLVSIITPLYNGEQFILDTIESVLVQSNQEWEMIIVNDHSTDHSLAIAEECAKNEPRIKVITLPVNSGPAVARNRAIKEAKGRYIAFLDSDDLWHPKKLERQIKFMQENDHAFSFTYYEQMNEQGDSSGKIIAPPDKVNYEDMLKAGHIGCLTAIYDTRKLGKAYMPLIKKRQDYGLWLELLKEEQYAYCLPEVLAFYRVRKSSLSSNKLKLLKYNWKLLREIEHLSVIKSLYYLFRFSSAKVFSMLNLK